VNVAVAGTFGPRHDGHRSLLETALAFGDRVVVGLTTDELARSSRTRPVPRSRSARLASGPPSRPSIPTGRSRSAP